MQELINAIQVAFATDASAEHKATGAQACRTILAALDTEPGKPIVLPGMPLPAVTSRVSVDQIIDLMIARLTTIAAERDVHRAPIAPDPWGLRVPVTPAALPRSSRRPAAQPKRPTVARKP